MSFPNREAYLEHKARGLMPTGGPYPGFDALSDAPRESLFPDEREALLREAKEIFREHPGDMRLYRRICELVGRQLSLAEAHDGNFDAQIEEARES